MPTRSHGEDAAAAAAARAHRLFAGKFTYTPRELRGQAMELWSKQLPFPAAASLWRKLVVNAMEY